MFNRYIHTNDFLKLPLSGNLYSININGVILDIYGNPILSYINDKEELVVKIQWIDGYKEYKVSLLLALTFKPLHIPFKHWKEVDLMYLDDNKLNYHLSNTIVKFARGGIECDKYQGFKYIPGFTRYAVNEKGEVKNHITGSIISTHINEKGYRQIRLKCDMGDWVTTGLHRVIGYSWLPYPLNVDDLYINHLDGDKLNNCVKNLEWCTAKENTKHAIETGLIKNQVPILVKDVKNNKVYSFSNVHKCERLLNIPTTSIYGYLDGEQKLYRNRFLFKKENDNAPWATFEESRALSFGKGKNRFIKVRNVLTNEITNYPSVQNASKALNIPSVNILALLNNLTWDRPIYIFEFRDEHDDRPWSSYNSFQIDAFCQAYARKKLFSGRGYLLTDISNNQKTPFAFIEDVCNYTNVGIASIINACKKKFTVNCKWKVEHLFQSNQGKFNEKGK
jgi:hypothetical protein